MRPVDQATGTEVVEAKTIQEGCFDIIEDRARQYLACVAKARAEMKSAASA